MRCNSNSFAIVAATVVFLTTFAVHAVPIAQSNVGPLNHSLDSGYGNARRGTNVPIHARERSQLQLPQPPPEALNQPKARPAAIGDQSKQKHSNKIDSKVIINFWGVREFTAFEEAAAQQGLARAVVHDTLCSEEDMDNLKPKINRFLQGVSQLALQGTPTFQYTNKCLKQWLPIFNSFDLEVEDSGAGGKCKKGEMVCNAEIYFGTGHGSVYNQATEEDPFYHTTTSEDDDAAHSHRQLHVHQ